MLCDCFEIQLAKGKVRTTLDCLGAPGPPGCWGCWDTHCNEGLNMALHFLKHQKKLVWISRKERQRAGSIK